MEITINGTRRTIEAGSTVGSLLEQLGLAGKPVVVELNQRALFSREYAGTIIPDAAVIEIVTLAAGG
jgi:thiamine biosynthesis protein ThiS